MLKTASTSAKDQTTSALSENSNSVTIIICGNHKCGKASLIRRWLNGNFESATDSNRNFCKSINVGNRKISVNLRPIKAEEIFSSDIGKSFFAGIDGIAFVYDATDQKSLSVLSFWLEQIAKRIGDGYDFPVSFLIGNKIDDPSANSAKAVKPKAIHKFFSSELRLRASYRVSAKTGEKVDEAFRHLVMACLVTRIESTKLRSLIPGFMLQALAKVGAKVRLKYENKEYSPFDASLDGFEPNCTSSPQAFILSRMADNLPHLLSSQRFLLILKIAVQSNTLPVAKVALKCFQKFLALGYLEGRITAAEEWIENLVQQHGLIESQYQDLIVQTMVTFVQSLRGYRFEILAKAFGICFHAGVINTTQSFDDALFQIVKRVLDQDLGVASFQQRFSKPPTRKLIKGDNGLEAVLGFFEDDLTLPALDHRKAHDHTSITTQNQATLLFEEIFWLATGNNRFVKVRGLAPYIYRSRFLFMNLINNIVKDIPVTSAENLLVATRSRFLETLVDCGVSCQLELFDRLISFTMLLLTRLGTKSSLKEEMAVLIELIVFSFESLHVPGEFKAIIKRFLLNLSSSSQLLLDIFVEFDCRIRYANLFERLIASIANILAQPLQSGFLNASIREEEIAAKRACYNNVAGFFQFLAELSRAKRGKNDVAGETFDKVRARKILYLNGIELFNTHNPVKGIKFLQENGFASTKTSRLVELLRQERRFDRMAVGDYLGEPDKESLNVMKAFIDTFDFTNIDFLPSLRKLFLHGFRLPGESQKIDRIMENFARRWTACNPDQHLMASSSAAHTLAFSIIMLNTDLHSPNVKQRMSKEEFAKNNRGINDGKDFPRNFLDTIYDSVLKEKILVTVSYLEISRQSTAGSRSSGNLRAVGGSQQVAQTAFEIQTELVRLAVHEAFQTLLASKKFLRREDILLMDASNPPICAIKAIFQTTWTILQPSLKTGLESVQPSDDDVAGICIDAVFNALLLASDFESKNITQACTMLLSGFTEKITSAPLTESMLNVICSVGGRSFISNFLRSSV